jgi:hypothetical protein
LDEIAVGLLDGVRASCKFVALGLAVLEEALNTFVLHRILNSTEHDALLIRRADFKGLRESNHCCEELLVDAFVDVDTLGGNADLARVEESAHGDFWGYLGNVDVWTDDAGVVASKLERDTLQGRGCCLHNLLSSGD